MLKNQNSLLSKNWGMRKTHFSSFLDSKEILVTLCLCSFIQWRIGNDSAESFVRFGWIVKVALCRWEATENKQTGIDRDREKERKRLGEREMEGKEREREKKRKKRKEIKRKRYWIKAENVKRMRRKWMEADTISWKEYGHRKNVIRSRYAKI